MIIERLESRDPACDAFVKTSHYGKIYHLFDIQKVIADTFGHETIYLCAKANDRVDGVLPLVHMRSRVFGNFLVSVPFFNYGGVCAASHEAENALLQEAIAIAKTRNVSHLELRHEDLQFPHLSNKSHKVAMTLDLPDSEDQLWETFKSKLRSQIRKPEKEGVVVKIGKLDLLEDFYQVFAANMRDLGTPVYSKTLFMNMLKTFSGNAWLVNAYKDKQPIAGGFVLGFRDTLEIPWASSLRKYNSLAANMLMYWEALKLAIREGYKKFDFGRSTPDEGTYKFKAQWGARPVALHWEYWLANGCPLPDISPNNRKYQMAIRVWQNLPLPITRLLGPSIVRNIP